MRPGGGAAKGADFERSVCKRLSKWLTRRQRDDLFWRTAMSGGRATLQRKKGHRAAAQVGDIGAIDAAGERLTSLFVMECKSYKDLHFTSFLQAPDAAAQGTIHHIWQQCVIDARDHSKLPMLIARQNILGEFIVLDRAGLVVFDLPTHSANHFPAALAYVFWFPAFLAMAKRP